MRRRTESRSWKMAEFAPIPKASDSAATAKKAGRAFTLPAISFERKKNTAFRLLTRPLTQNIGRLFGVIRHQRHLEPNPGGNEVILRANRFRIDPYEGSNASEKPV